MNTPKSMSYAERYRHAKCKFTAYPIQPGGSFADVCELAASLESLHVFTGAGNSYRYLDVGGVPTCGGEWVIRLSTIGWTDAPGISSTCARLFVDLQGRVDAGAMLYALRAFTREQDNMITQVLTFCTEGTGTGNDQRATSVNFGINDWVLHAAGVDPLAGHSLCAEENIKRLRACQEYAKRRANNN